MKNQIDLLNEIFEKYNNKFSSFFHRALWNVMVKNVQGGKIVAFTSNYNKNGLQLGLAYANEPGFSPSPAYFKDSVKYDDAQDIIDDMNKMVFELDEKTASNIVASSMRTL